MVEREAGTQSALITGFPRLLARGLTLRMLHLRPDNQVTLLAAPEDVEAAREFVDALAADEAPRVRVLRGRLTDVDLGVSGAEVRRLLKETTIVFHAATLMTGPRASLRQHNIGGLLTLTGMGMDMERLERFCFFSTAFVSGDRAGVIEEEDLEHGQRFRTGYTRSMFDAERIIRQLMPRLPVTVLRPGGMLGHSRTGEADGLYEGPILIVRLLVKLPAEVPLFLPGSGVVPLNIVPIDYVVRAACVLAQKPEAAGRTFHLTDPNPLSARHAFEILSDLVNRPAPFTGSLPARAFRQVLRLPGVTRLAPRKIALLKRLDMKVDFRCSGALELLSGSGVVCPPFESYADQLIGWVAQFERERRAEARAEAAGADAGENP